MQHRTVYAAGLVGAFVLTSGALGQVPHLVKNISLVSSSGSNPGTPVTQGSLAFFQADDGVHGAELWVTDGTEAGTRLVKDIRPGSAASSPASFAPIGTTSVIFLANDGTTGQELWISDGTEPGTVLLADIRSGTSGSSPANFTALDSNTILFTATSTAAGAELWRTDGTPAGTQLVLDIAPGTASSNPGALTRFNGRVYFRATSAALGGTELWSTEGTALGTSRVADINTAGDSSPDLLTVSGGKLFFIATVAADTELYAYDGANPPVLVKNCSPTGSGLSTSSTLIDIGGMLYFSATDGTSGRELWKSDGTTAGTVRVVDLRAGSADGIGPATPLFPIFQNLNGHLLFVGNGPGGYELWTSDGTASGTTPVADLLPDSIGSNPINLRVVGSAPNARLFFAATNAVVGQELYVSDGTPSGTRLAYDGRLGSPTASGAPQSLADFNGVLLCSINGTFTGRELFRSDGTPEGTRVVKDIVTPNANQSGVNDDLLFINNRAMLSIGNRTYFRASDGLSGLELWSTDGTSGGTVRIADLNPGSGASNPSGLTNVGGRLFFAATDGASGAELYALDAAGVPYRVKDIGPGAASGLSGTADITNLNGIAIFVANDGSGQEMWRSDGTDAGTYKIQDIAATPGSTLSAGPLLVIGSRAYFAARGDLATGVKLWSTDGLTVDLAADITPANFSSDKPYLAALSGKLYFSADANIDGVPAGEELWSYDPATGLASPVKDIRPGSLGSSPAAFVVMGDRIYFTANDGTTGYELWTTDGTAAGTTPVTNLQGTNAGVVNATSLVPVNGRLFFGANNGVDGLELWMHDPASGVTRMMAPTPGGIKPTGDANPLMITGARGIAYCSANDDLNNYELWRSDGTDAGTFQVADINPGSATSNPRNMLSFGSRLLFTASNGFDGEELWILDLCPADFDNSGSLAIEDIFQFVAAWFTGDPRADFNGGGLNVSDIFEFLNAWLAGCP